MNKIPTLFERDPNDRAHVLRTVTPGCEWVIAGQGVATRKYDGTCVMFDGVSWWARREVKAGKEAPPNYRPLGTDEATGKTMGWEPVEQSAFAKFHAEALNPGALDDVEWPEGTYELIGPKINGNPENWPCHGLIRHADAVPYPDAPRDYDGLGALLGAQGIEGFVWHHEDGRMVKVKRCDFP